MRITVKTLQGKTFQVECGATAVISELKLIVERAQADLPADKQKLIHSGKVLKDDAVVGELNLGEAEFLVCMISKAKEGAKPVATASASTSTPATSSAVPTRAVAATSTAAALAAIPPAVSATTRPAVAVTRPAVTSAARPVAAAVPENPAHVAQLMEMGFVETDVRAALRAARGNPDVAVNYLMEGIPPSLLASSGSGGGGRTASPPMPPSSSAMVAADTHDDEGDDDPDDPLSLLRHHPQINDLRRIIQSNPSALQTVLEQIGSQSPELLEAIHANQEAFIALLNEPPTADNEGGMHGMANMIGGGGGGGMPFSPTQIAQALSSMPESRRAEVASMMGMSVTQLNSVISMMGSMPPEQLEGMMNMMGAMMGGGGGGGGGHEGHGHGGGGARPGTTTLRLSPEEAQSVQRLTELGFSREDALQAYLACDKNESLAANLLFDGTFSNSFGGGGSGSGSGGSSGGSGGGGSGTGGGSGGGSGGTGGSGGGSGTGTGGGGDMYS